MKGGVVFRLAAAVLASGVALGAAQRPADDNAFPRTKSHGRATVEYRDERVKAVAIYDYSQRNHNQAWLLVQFGVALYERTAVRRESFHLIMPGGRSVPLATQEQFLADAARIRQFRQNAGIFSRNLASYFPQSARGDGMRWVALPGDGLIRELVVIPEEQGVALGDLYFKSPTLRWEAGMHRLVFDHEKGHAELPIRLQ
jgi:hypothetical protein